MEFPSISEQNKIKENKAKQNNQNYRVCRENTKTE
jgi:hypothetical protein